MKRNTFSAIGGWQSFFFCVGMYVVALFFSIFLCSSIFFALNTRSDSSKSNLSEKSVSSSTAKQELASVGH